MNKWKKFVRHFSLALLFTAFVFGTMLISMLIVFGGMNLLMHFGIIAYPSEIHRPLLLFTRISLVVGIIMSLFISKRPLRPWFTLSQAADEIANGNFDVRVQPKGPPAVRQLFHSFNHMADELGSVEMLRSDFINNFSHEFKTPIVSISGFAKMLKRDDLTDEERTEYLDIIIAESDRLTNLASNVLYLSKIEQQSILTDKSSFNVSEQLRLIIAMMMNKWAEKTIEIQFDCDEIFINGNEELLQQVWINLLDNALKFAPGNSIVDITVRCDEDGYHFAFTNTGNELSDEVIIHIFDKFYQGDTSHTEKGNGLGLTIAKKIVELHDGIIHVLQSGNAMITFEVVLPNPQATK